MSQRAIFSNKNYHKLLTFGFDFQETIGFWKIKNNLGFLLFFNILQCVAFYL